MLPESTGPFLSKLWIGTLILASAFILMGLEIAIFGLVPGMTDPERIQNTALILVLTSAVLYVISFIAGFGHELGRMQRNRGGASW